MAVSKRVRFRIFARDNFTCRYCGRSAPDVVLHIDHVHPVSRGGTDKESNLVTACADCNVCKQAKLIRPADRPADPRTAEAPPTVPHVDRCRACGPDTMLYLAEREEPAPPRGYSAFYRCEHGHRWRTYWDSTLRLTPTVALSIVAERVAGSAEALHG